MRWIAHRGNLRGPNPERENHPEYVIEALDAGFHCEIDVWNIAGYWFLGHDKATDDVDYDLLTHPRIWCHAKDIETLELLLDADDRINCFWHQSDDVTLTRRGYIWTYPGKPLTERSICLKPEETGQDYSKCAGVCSDYIADLKEKWDR